MSEVKHQFDFAPEYTGQANIKVVGVGGAGGNAIDRMIESGLKGVEFVAINTDAQVLNKNSAETRVQIGAKLTNGLGAGANPDVGKEAVEESRQEVSEALGKPNLVFITAGMGGGTGTGAAPLVAEIAKQSGALTVAIVTKPFRFEGRKRIVRAEQGLADLKSKVDTLITIPNERLLEIVDRKTTLTNAFATADEVLYQATKGISDLITVPGLINCDFADVRTVMLEMGDALMGTGYGEGEERAIKAAQEAISSPLLEDVCISGAHGLLINITGGNDMTLHDVNTATSLIYDEAGDDANIIFGAVIDETMDNQMRVTVIATGIGQEENKKEVVAEVAKPVKVDSNPGRPLALFPEEVMKNPVGRERVIEAASAIKEESRSFVEAEAETHYEPEHPRSTEESESGNGNGNGHIERASGARVPVFSEADRTIPAYLRRLRDRN